MLLPLGVIKNYRDRRSVAAPISAMQLVVLLCMKITSVCVAPCSPRLPYLRIMPSLSRRAQTDFGRKACPVIQIDTEVRVLNSSSFNLAKIKDLSLLSLKMTLTEGVECRSRVSFIFCQEVKCRHSCFSFSHDEKMNLTVV